MKKPILQYIKDFTIDKVVPLVLIGSGLVGGGYFCTYEHRLENVVVEELGADCGIDRETGETSCVGEIEVSDHWKCLYILDGDSLKKGTKLEYLKWHRGFRIPLLECDRVLEYKIAGDEKIHNY